MKKLIVTLASLVLFTNVFASTPANIDLDRLEGTALENISLEVLADNCPALFNGSNSVAAFADSVSFVSGYGHSVKLYFKVWLESGKKGIATIKFDLDRANDEWNFSEFSTDPKNLCK